MIMINIVFEVFGNETCCDCGKSKDDDKNLRMFICGPMHTPHDATCNYNCYNCLDDNAIIDGEGNDV